MAARIEAVAPPDLAQRPTRLAPPCALVIFGATGDLTRRKLVPALYNITAGGLLGEHVAIVGVSRREIEVNAFREDLRAGVNEFSRLKPVDAGVWTAFASRIEYVPGEFEDPATYQRLAKRLEQLDRERGLEGNRLFYLATPPDVFSVILHRLKAAGLIHPIGEAGFTRVILEKPFGRDLASAQALNGLVAKVLDESQTFRIDHYLGKETVQNIMVFRFANSIFEPLWNRKYVDHVQITAAETVGIGSRGKFYEQTGVLRDIVQNHLLEVMSLVGMEPPNSNEADDVRTEKLKVLRALRETTPATIEHDVALGQYRGYRQEPDVAPDSLAPTFAALRVFIDNWRWQGVPFYLRTGKKLAKRATEVSLFMQRIPLCLFGRGESCEPNVLTLRIQPDEGIALTVSSKIPGHDLAVGQVSMDMKYVEAFGGEPPEAYERLLLDAMRGDPTLFSRRDAVEASWEWITPILRYFEEHPPRDFPNYEPGSWGPRCADELIRRDRRSWHPL